jgi:hypothetical protein
MLLPPDGGDEEDRRTRRRIDGNDHLGIKPFDLMVKAILSDTSPKTLVHFINGLFDAQYPPDSPVTFAATESVSRQDDHLAGIRSDMLLTGDRLTCPLPQLPAPTT